VISKKLTHYRRIARDEGMIGVRKFLQQVVPRS